jgi:predicted anti-sigma-YlaC factor YlaD
VEKDRFEHWLKNIYNTQEEEISCSECFDSVSHFVDAELAGEHPEIKMPRVKQHLDQCPACHAEYETLRDLRRLEEEDKLPSVDDLEDLIP